MVLVERQQTQHLAQMAVIPSFISSGRRVVVVVVVRSMRLYPVALHAMADLEVAQERTQLLEVAASGRTETFQPHRQRKDLTEEAEIASATHMLAAAVVAQAQ